MYYSPVYHHYNIYIFFIKIGHGILIRSGPGPAYVLVSLSRSAAFDLKIINPLWLKKILLGASMHDACRLFC